MSTGHNHWLNQIFQIKISHPSVSEHKHQPRIPPNRLFFFFGFKSSKRSVIKAFFTNIQMFTHKGGILCKVVETFESGLCEWNVTFIYWSEIRSRVCFCTRWKLFSPLRAWVLEYLKRNMNVTDFSWHFSSKTISNFIFIILLSIWSWRAIQPYLFGAVNMPKLAINSEILENMAVPSTDISYKCIFTTPRKQIPGECYWKLQLIIYAVMKVRMIYCFLIQ